MKNIGNSYMHTGVFAVSLAIFFLALIVFEKIGVPRRYGVFLSALYGLLLVAIPVMKGASTRSAKYFFADRMIDSTTIALAIGPQIAFPFLIMGTGAAFSVAPGLLVMFSVAGCCGLALMTLFASRQFRQSGATTLANFQLSRFNSLLSARLSASLNLIAGTMILLAAYRGATLLATWYFGLTGGTAILLFSLVLIVTTTFGGIASTTRQCAIAMVCLLLAVNIPLVLEALDATRLPFGHLSFGSAALNPILELEQQLKAAGFPLLDSAIQTDNLFYRWSADNLAIAAFCTAIGIAGMPSLMQQFATINYTDNASKSGEKAILLFGLLTISIFALLAFTKYSLYESLLGLTTGEVRDEAKFLFQWSDNISGANTGLVSICGQFANSANAVIDACGGSPSHIINIQDLQFDGNLVLAAAPAFNGYPFALTAFLIIAILLSSAGLAGATLLSIANNLVAAFYSPKHDKVASTEVFLSRLTLMFLVGGISLVSLYLKVDMISLPILALSIYGACFLPALISAILWKNTNGNAISVSIAVGFVPILIYWLLASYGVDWQADTGDEVRLSIPGIVNQLEPQLGVVLGLPFSVLTLIIMNYFSRNDPHRQEGAAFANAIFEEDDEVVIARNRF